MIVRTKHATITARYTIIGLYFQDKKTETQLEYQWQSKSQKEISLLSFFLLKSRFKLCPFITKSRLESLITIL